MPRVWGGLGDSVVKLVNIRNDDITDGNPKLTLGLIWTIILHFQRMQGGRRERVVVSPGQWNPCFLHFPR
ncbi:hypothetical protein IHE44_0008114 [Lamprotornis superbus]|uniref:Calponin-homology (CH) domain-containing protein n=1 Tax=Lamprotornis superbus TaxID=245042 RepID=A0A835NIE2_9PASS|nr:hypothetical protein IHE44_0008114 [Lamprotornis superbus]